MLAALAFWQRERLHDPALLRGLGALLVGELLLLPTVFKVGTSLNLIAVAEPAAIALGASGIVVLLRARGAGATRVALGAAGVCAGLVALQSASLVAQPGAPAGVRAAVLGARL